MTHLRLQVYTAATKIPSNEVDLDLKDDASRAPFAMLQTLIQAHTGLQPRDQHLMYGKPSFPIQDDTDVQALVRRIAHADFHTHETSPHHFVSVYPAKILMTAVQDACSRVYFGDKAVLQPCYMFPGSDHPVCESCQANCFPEGFLQAQNSPLLRPFVCAAASLCAEGLGTYIFAERLDEAGSLCCRKSEEDPALRGSESPRSMIPEGGSLVLSPPALALLDKFRQAAHSQQASQFKLQSREGMDMMGRLQSGCTTFSEYESAALKNKALAAIPLAMLHANALAAGGDPFRRPLQFHDTLLRELLAWFKRDFFVWVNNPPCDGCGSTDTKIVGGVAPTVSEAAGKASRVEVYGCKMCPKQTRFPRFNDPGVLLETRRGRCGEWANCFTLCCVAMGFESRYVMDWTDHVWTEVWSPAQERFIHLDSCENAADTPLMYEGGWGKKLSYVIAFGRNHCVDVSRRYTRNFENEMLSRRQSVPEQILIQQIASLNQQLCRNGLSAPVRQSQERMRQEQFELHSLTVLKDAGGGMNIQASERQGRISGDAAWKRARGEDGADLPSAGQQDRRSASVTSVSQAPIGKVEESDKLSNKMETIEREEMAGMPLWPSVPGQRSWFISATSVSSVTKESVARLGAKAGFGPEAITVNGMPVAVGIRGLNVVVLNLSCHIVEQSVAFKTSGASGEETESVDDENPALLFLKEHAVEEKLVLCVMLGQGSRACWDAAAYMLEIASGGASERPEHSQPCIVFAGIKAVTEFGRPRQHFAQVFVTIPLPNKSFPTRFRKNAASRWDGAIATTPVMHQLGPLGDGILSDSPLNTYNALCSTFPKAPLKGFAYKPGYGLVGMAQASGLRRGDGWITEMAWPSRPSAEDDIKVRVRRLFDLLVSEGMEPNVAAAKALHDITPQGPKHREEENSLRGDQLQQAPPDTGGMILRYISLSENQLRSCRGTIEAFDDFEVATPIQAMVERQQGAPILRLQRLRVWSSSNGITGLQAGYGPLKSGSPFLLWAPVHNCLAGSAASTTFSPDAATTEIVLGTEEGFTEIKISKSDECIVGLCFKTTACRELSVGVTESAGSRTSDISVPPGWQVTAFWGTLGQHGLHSLGMIIRLGSLESSSSWASTLSLPADAWGVHTSCRVDRATCQLLRWTGEDISTVLTVLRAARRYLENCLKDPSNTKFRLIRVRSKFFLDNIGKVPGSGHLMQALGFEHIAAAATAFSATEYGKPEEEEACYTLPLFQVVPSRLKRNIYRLDVNITRLVDMSAS